MRKICILLFLVCVFNIVQAEKTTQKINRVGKELFIEDHGIRYAVNPKVVNVKPISILDGLGSEYKIIHHGEFGYVDIEIPEGTDIQEYVEELNASGLFETVEYIGDTRVYFTPNDSLLSNQDHIGHLHFDRVWDITKGNPNIKVAVIDTGIYRYHPDIGYGNDYYTNISYTLGYDYFAYSTYETPTDGHGTKMAGYIGAKMNNIKGVAGISGGNNSAGVTLISYHAIDTIQGSLSSSYVGDAIKKAVDQGARVINISAGPSFLTKTEEAIDYAYSHNVTIVCATGNDTLSNISYPAYNAKTIAVGGSNNSGGWKLGSNYGVGLDIIAFAELTKTTGINTNLYTISGFTSAAAAIVSGTVALMLSVNPSLTTTQVRDILRSTAKKPSGYTYNSNGWEAHVGYGELDPFVAVLAAGNINFLSPAVICDNTSTTLTINNVPSGMYVSWRYEGDDNSPTPPFSMYSSGNTSCVITGTSSTSFFGKIIAEIRSGGSIYATFEKRVRGVSALTGTFHQQGGYIHYRNYPTFTKPLNSSIVVNQECVITLQSPKFRDMNISVSQGGSYVSWSYDGDQTITFTPIYSNSQRQFVFTGTGNVGSCNNFSITVTSTNVPIASRENAISIGVEGSQINVKLMCLNNEKSTDTNERQEQTLIENLQWTLEVYNTTTGEKVFDQNVIGAYYIVDTTDWKSGVYAVRAIIGDEVLSEKVIVK